MRDQELILITETNMENVNIWNTKNAFYSETFSGQNSNQYLTSVHLINTGSN
jgi:hypothetical protein